MWVSATTGSCTFPVHWQSKRQGSIARSTTEAERISMASGLFGEVYNIQSFLEQLTLGDIEVCFWQDNIAVLQVLQAGYSAKPRHCGRVHRINVASLPGALQDPSLKAERCPTQLQKANGLTKIIPPHEWITTLLQYRLQQDAS